MCRKSGTAGFCFVVFFCHRCHQRHQRHQQRVHARFLGVLEKVRRDGDEAGDADAALFAAASRVFARQAMQQVLEAAHLVAAGFAEAVYARLKAAMTPEAAR